MLCFYSDISTLEKFSYDIKKADPESDNFQVKAVNTALVVLFSQKIKLIILRIIFTNYRAIDTMMSTLHASIACPVIEYSTRHCLFAAIFPQPKLKQSGKHSTRRLVPPED